MACPQSPVCRTTPLLVGVVLSGGRCVCCTPFGVDCWSWTGLAHALTVTCCPTGVCTELEVK